jgi:protocatechuate 3,4-dioxygenase beta subunit
MLARDLKRNLATIHQVDEKMTNLDITLQEGLTLSVQVRDSSGQAVTNATGMATIWSDPQRGYSLNQRPVPTDAYGHLRITGLPQGKKYWVQIEAANHTSATRRTEADDTRTNLLELPPVVLTTTDGNVSGQVLDNEGKPAAGIEVQMFSSGMPIPRTTTDPNGRFEFHGTRPNVKSVLVGLDTAHDLAATLELDETTTTTNIDLHLQKGFTLSGLVQDMDGTPLTNAIVSLSMTLNGQTEEQGKTQSNANGSFIFNALSPEGEYNLDVSAGGYGSVTKWGLQFTDIQSHSLQLPPIQLKLTNLQLAGTVVGPDDKPIPGVYVRIYGPDQFSGQEEMLDATNSDAGGHFLFKPVAGERMRVAAATGQGDQSIIGSLQVQGGDTNVLLKLQH